MAAWTSASERRGRRKVHRARRATTRLARRLRGPCAGAPGRPRRALPSARGVCRAPASVIQPPVVPSASPSPPTVPVIGVVVVNWNGADDTLEALASLWGADPRPARVVVVDNASHDDSVARLTRWAEARGVDHELLEPGDAPRGRARPWLSVLRSAAN